MLDGTNRGTYAAIRGLDAFDKVPAGIQVAADAGVRWVTLQRANYRELPKFVDLAPKPAPGRSRLIAVEAANATPYFVELHDFF